MIEYNEEYDNLILGLIKDYPRSYFKKIRARSNRHLYDYIISCTKMLDDRYDLATRSYWTINHITSFPLCKICGKELKQNISATVGYPDHCSQKCVMNDPKILEHHMEMCEQKYGLGIINNFQAQEVKDKIYNKNIKKWGCKVYTQTDEYKKLMKITKIDRENKKIITHIKNKSFNTSKYEDIIYYLIRKKFPDVKHCYTSNEYPFEIDFFIPSINLYIDYNGNWTHNDHPFNENDPNDILKRNEWINKKNKFYDNAIYTWTDLDVRKRKIAKQYNINRVEFWNIESVYEWLFPNYNNVLLTDELLIVYDRKRLYNEFKYYNNIGKIDSIFNSSKRNFIIDFFQQDIIFRNSKSLWKTGYINKESVITNNNYKQMVGNNLIINILKDIKNNDYDVIHYNPLLFKYFIDKYSITSCYNPFGGVGDGVLGGLKLKTNIINIDSQEAKENVDRIINYFNIKNTKTYCENSLSFIPYDSYESMFTKTSNVDDINQLFNIFNKNNDCKLFGIISDNQIEILYNNFIEKSILSHNNIEYLYVFTK